MKFKKGDVVEVIDAHSNLHLANGDQHVVVGYNNLRNVLLEGKGDRGFFERRFKKVLATPVQGVQPSNTWLDIREKNEGNSDYSKHVIQPWDIWEEYGLNGWDCDIVKRVLRTKEDATMTPREQRILDYKKIIHNCEERIRQLEK